MSNQYNVVTGSGGNANIPADGFLLSDGHLIFYTGGTTKKEYVAMFAPSYWRDVRHKPTTEKQTSVG